ncbi:MAG: hypothetical protein AB1730_14915 [Myxococcota bacterium]
MTISISKRSPSLRPSTPNVERKPPPPARKPELPRVPSRFEANQPPPVDLNVCRKPPTRDEAIAKARELLEGQPTERQDGTSVVVEDAPYVNDQRDVNGKRADAAVAQLGDNAQLEAEALAKLSPKDRARYLSVKETLLEPSDGKPHGDPVAALALQTLLLEGKLPGEKALGGKDTLLGGLAKLTKQELAEGVDRQTLLADLVQEVAVPEAVAQRNKGTCVPTSIEIQLLQTNPAEYVRLVAGLASPEGEVTTRGGDVIKREDGVLDDGTPRSLPQKLLAPALMELGNGLADYDNADDKHHGGGIEGQGGLTAAQADVVLESLYGHDFAFQNVSSGDEKKAATDFVLDEVAAGRSVLVGMKWGDGGHKVLVTGTETRDGVEYVKIINPWGREELIPRDDFEARLRNVNYDPNAGFRSFWDKVTRLLP